MASLRVFIMAWIFLSGLIGTGLVGPVRPAIEAEFGLSHAAFGGGLAVCQIAVNVALLLAILPRLGRLTGALRLGLGLLCGAGGLSLAFLAREWPGYLAGWSMLMAGTMLAGVLNNISMTLWRDDPRRGVVLLHAFNAIGKVAGPLTVSSTLTLGWRGGYQIAAGLNALLLAAFLLACRRWGEVLDSSSALPATAKVGFRLPGYWLALAGIGSISGGEAAFATLMPTYFIQVRGLTEQQASLLLALHLVGLATGRFVAAGCGTRVSNRRVIVACLACGVGIFPAILAPSPWLYGLGLFLLGGMFSATWPAFFAEAAERLTEHRSLLAYGSSLGNVVGIALCVWASSLIADEWLTASMFCGPVVLWTFGVGYWIADARRVSSSRRRP